MLKCIVRGSACGIASALSRMYVSRFMHVELNAYMICNSGGMIAPILGGILLVMNRAVPVYTAVIVFAIAGFCVLLLKEDENSRREKRKVLLHWIDSYIVFQIKRRCSRSNNLEAARRLFTLGKVCCCVSTSHNKWEIDVRNWTANPNQTSLSLFWAGERLLWDSLDTCFQVQTPQFSHVIFKLILKSLWGPSSNDSSETYTLSPSCTSAY